MTVLNNPSGAAAARRPVLAIETSTAVARVVVVDGETGMRLGAAEAAAARHSSNLLRLCVEAGEQAGVTVSDFGAIACGAGPGSFTGLRVGLAVAKGLAMPGGVPLVLVSSLEALATDMLSLAAPDELLLSCLDAGKGQIYAGWFERRGSVGVRTQQSEWVVAPEALAERLPADALVAYAGPGAVRYRDVLAMTLGARARMLEVAGPSAVAVAARALEKLRGGEIADLGGAVPAYGRPPDITRPKRAT
jgi:tRNA threonylcarbamoyladenosine biosynthesis protein TsaB